MSLWLAPAGRRAAVLQSPARGKELAPGGRHAGKQRCMEQQAHAEAGSGQPMLCGLPMCCSAARAGVRRALPRPRRAPAAPSSTAHASPLPTLCACVQTNLILTSPETSLAEVTKLLDGPPSIEGLPVCDASKKARVAAGWHPAWVWRGRRPGLASLAACPPVRLGSWCSTRSRHCEPNRALRLPLVLINFHFVLFVSRFCAAGGRHLQEGPEEGWLHGQGACCSLLPVARFFLSTTMSGGPRVNVRMDASCGPSRCATQAAPPSSPRTSSPLQPETAPRHDRPAGCDVHAPHRPQGHWQGCGRCGLHDGGEGGSGVCQILCTDRWSARQRGTRKAVGAVFTEVPVPGWRACIQAVWLCPSACPPARQRPLLWLARLTRPAPPTLPSPCSTSSTACRWWTMTASAWAS